MQWSITTLVLLASTILCTSAAQIFQKRAAINLVSRQGQSKRKNASLLSKDIIITGLLLSSGLLLWLIVLHRMPVSIAYPLLSINYVIVMLSARWMFQESIPAHRWIGALSIMAGICLLVA